MSYNPTNWQDRVVEHPRRFEVQNNPDGTVTLIPKPGTVLQEGTPVNAANMNKLEQGLVSHIADYVRQPAYAVTSGTSTAYTVTLDPAPATIPEGFAITIVPHVTCGANPTLNVNGKGATQLRNSDNEQLGAGDLVAGSPYNFRKVGSYFFLSSGGGEVKIEFNNYCSFIDHLRSDATALPSARYDLAGASVGEYALFGGGNASSSPYAVVDAYNTSLVRSTPTALSTARMNLTGASVGGYALFAGGGSSLNSASAVVDAYSSSLVRSTPTALSVVRLELAGASVGDYALFAGGGSNSSSPNAIVDAYSSSLVRSTPTALSVARWMLAGASVGGYALFGGGMASMSAKDTEAATVDAYNTSLVRSTPTALSVARLEPAGASVGDYALFGGGGKHPTSNPDYDTVDAYNTSLVRSIPTALSVARCHIAGISGDDFALFGGGSAYSDYDSVAVVDVYDTSLVRSIPAILSDKRGRLAGAAVGNNALFAGGYARLSYSESVVFNNVDVYVAQPRACIPVTAGSKYKFTEATEQVAATSTTLVYDQKVTGYIKYKKGVISNG